VADCRWFSTASAMASGKLADRGSGSAKGGGHRTGLTRATIGHHRSLCMDRRAMPPSRSEQVQPAAVSPDRSPGWSAPQATRLCAPGARPYRPAESPRRGGAQCASSGLPDTPRTAIRTDAITPRPQPAFPSARHWHWSPYSHGWGFQPQHRHNWRERPASGRFVPPHSMCAWRADRRQMSPSPAGCGGVVVQFTYLWPDWRRQKAGRERDYAPSNSLHRLIHAGGREGRMSPCDPSLSLGDY
jgi:hypothetical protein